MTIQEFVDKVTMDVDEETYKADIKTLVEVILDDYRASRAYSEKVFSSFFFVQRINGFLRKISNGGYFVSVASVDLKDGQSFIRCDSMSVKEDKYIGSISYDIYDAKSSKPKRKQYFRDINAQAYSVLTLFNTIGSDVLPRLVIIDILGTAYLGNLIKAGALIESKQGRVKSYRINESNQVIMTARTMKSRAIESTIDLSRFDRNPTYKHIISFYKTIDDCRILIDNHDQLSCIETEDSRITVLTKVGRFLYNYYGLNKKEADAQNISDAVPTEETPAAETNTLPEPVKEPEVIPVVESIPEPVPTSTPVVPVVSKPDENDQELMCFYCKMWNGSKRTGRTMFGGPRSCPKKGKHTKATYVCGNFHHV